MTSINLQQRNHRSSFLSNSAAELRDYATLTTGRPERAIKEVKSKCPAPLIGSPMAISAKTLKNKRL